MRHGGRRPGAGRKPSLHAGAAKVRLRTREMIDQAAAEGVTPIAILLGTMRHLWAEAHRDGKPDLAIMKEACSIASQAAPFVHPRLASLAAKVETISGISDLISPAATASRCSIMTS